MNPVSHFDPYFFQAAATQPEPERLLLVFAAAELPDDATPAQRLRHAVGAGDALAPSACAAA